MTVGEAAGLLAERVEAFERASGLVLTEGQRTIARAILASVLVAAHRGLVDLAGPRDWLVLTWPGQDGDGRMTCAPRVVSVLRSGVVDGALGELSAWERAGRGGPFRLAVVVAPAEAAAATRLEPRAEEVGIDADGVALGSLGKKSASILRPENCGAPEQADRRRCRPGDCSGCAWDAG